MPWWLLLVAGCDRTEPVDPGPVLPLAAEVVDRFDPVRLRAHVDVLADDARGGRIPGSVGHDEARDYVLGELIESGLEPLGHDGGFVFTYPNEPTDRWQLEPDGTVVPNQTSIGYDLVGLLPGSDPALSDQYIVFMAHYDHLGVTPDGEVYNGAYDNAAAVAVGLELARVLVEAEAAPGRSIVFLFTDDEEAGLDGAEAWADAATVPIEDVVLAMSADPLGRAVLPDLQALAWIGTEFTPELRQVVESTRPLTDMGVYFLARDLVPVFSSDQDAFPRQGVFVPTLWAANPGMAFYHTVDDDPETIDYRILLEDTRYLAQVLTVLGNHPTAWTRKPAVHLGARAALDARALLEDVVASDELDDDERDHAAFLMAQLDEVVAADDVNVLDSPDATFLAAIYFVAFELGRTHPGPIPPPFPGEE